MLSSQRGLGGEREANLSSLPLGAVEFMQENAEASSQLSSACRSAGSFSH
ncbi:hypothetical protein HOV93_24010 [Planctomycetes bacterium FF15]|uniref:Uncharacterized protein n=1 Tax=Bremerella alba TaxID=980252 RepID=A0A7V8V5D8_9BACT|nr:hypothetical protein [Bremerella alba]